MNLRILVDNNTFIDQYYAGEPGISYYIEEEGKAFLFDVGYSRIFLDNAFSMGISITSVDEVILSHGHNDHTRGLLFLHELYAKHHRRNVPILAHPQVFAPRRVGPLHIGAPISPERLCGVFAMRLEKGPVWLSKRLVYLGEIKRITPFEGKVPIGEIYSGGQWMPDYVWDDTALAYCSEQGLVIITGCAHAGICNIIEQAKRICRDERVAAVVGGFHLLNPDKETLEKTVEYFHSLHPKAVYAAHCCDFPSKYALAGVVPVMEAGVNLSLSWE